MAGQFSVSIKRFAEATQLKLDDVLLKVLFDISTKVVEKSPVGNRELWAINAPEKRSWRVAHGRPDLKPEGYVGGRFRANWQFGETTAPSGELHEKSPPASGYPSQDAVIGELHTQMLSAKFGKNYWIVNNLPYAYRLEVGWSTQAPTGMVATTMANAQSIVSEAVDSVKAK